MIEAGTGNLLTADVEALVNTVNTVGVMGKGIALQFKKAFPANFLAYQAACKRGDVRLGHVWAFDTGVLGPRRYVLNFPTKQHWRSSSRLADVSAGLESLVRTVDELGVKSLAIPALGCGNGGLSWSEVRPLIEHACAQMPDVRVVIFAPAGAPSPQAMPNATPQPPLTRSRALLVTAISRYLERARLQEVRDGISELEIQKLAYFLQIFGAPLRLEFVRGTYGPYAPRLGQTLEAMERSPPHRSGRPVGSGDRFRTDQSCRRERRSCRQPGKPPRRRSRPARGTTSPGRWFRNSVQS